MKISQVHSIIERGDFDTQRVRPWGWDAQRMRFWRKHHIALPGRKQLKLIGNPKDLRIVLNPITITVELDGGEWLQYRFNKGWITDLASVPWFARGIIDNDDLDLLAAAYVHDANFSHHYLGDTNAGLERTNDLFREMIKYRGHNLKAWFAHAAVDSIIGHALYQKMPYTRGRVCPGRVEFAASNPLYYQL